MGLFVAEQTERHSADTKFSWHETVDGDHGRIETRKTTVFHDVDWLQERHDWPGLQSVDVVESTKEIDGRTGSETRLYTPSLVLLAMHVSGIIRSH